LNTTVTSPARFAMIPFTIGPWAFGAEISPVTGMFLPEDCAVRSTAIVRIEECLALPRQNFLEARILRIRADDDGACGVMVDAPGTITEYPCTDVRVLPPLLETMLRPRGIWGALAEDRRVRFLVDLAVLCRARPAPGGNRDYGKQRNRRKNTTDVMGER